MIECKCKGPRQELHLESWRNCEETRVVREG